MQNSQPYQKNDAVKTIVAAEGTVLPEISTQLLAYMRAETIDLSNADASQVTSLASMFYSCEQLVSIDLSGWDTSNNTSLVSTFGRCKLLESADLSGWDSTNVISTSHMFTECYLLAEADLTGRETPALTSTYAMFNECSHLTAVDLSLFNTENVTEINKMFYDCRALEKLDLRSFDTSNVTSFEDMFSKCGELTQIIVSDKWSNESVEKEYNDVFKGCEKLVGGNGTLYYQDYVYIGSACIDTFETPGYFTDASGSLTPPPVTDVTIDEATDLDGDGMLSLLDVRKLLQKLLTA